MSRRILTPRLMTLALLALVAATTGCYPTYKPAYVLQKRPTLVMVDDPYKQLHTPALSGYIASALGQILAQEALVSEVVPPERVRALAHELGDEYNRTPIDRVGKEVGAEQVLHLEIVRIQLQTDPGLFRPSAQVRVKVVDAVAGKRLFPSADQSLGGMAVGGYKTVEINMPPVHSVDSGRGQEAMLSRSVAQRIARDVGRLFHEWEQIGIDE